jgi:hypothetical protein
MSKHQYAIKFAKSAIENVEGALTNAKIRFQNTFLADSGKTYDYW